MNSITASMKEDYSSHMFGLTYLLVVPNFVLLLRLAVGTRS